MKKILIIDDDIISRKMLATTVEKMGFITIQSSNGRHGWETLFENPDITLVITDMMMPDMDGKELLHILRGNESYANLPVILISGVASESEISTLLGLGPTRFLAKPLNIKRLAEMVHEILG